MRYGLLLCHETLSQEVTDSHCKRTPSSYSAGDTCLCGDACDALPAPYDYSRTRDN